MSTKQNTSFRLESDLKKWADTHHAVLGFDSRTALFRSVFNDATTGALEPTAADSTPDETATASAELPAELVTWAQDGQLGCESASELLNDLLRTKREQVGDVFAEVEQ